MATIQASFANAAEFFNSLLEQAQSCIEAQKDKLTATELRAQMAEAEARKAKEALALVEEAIRKRLLRANPDADSRLTAMAG
jgi:hypothetical protein